MEYERQEIYSSAFTDIFGEGVKLWRKPELPKIEFKNGLETLWITVTKHAATVFVQKQKQKSISVRFTKNLLERNGKIQEKARKNHE